MGTQRRGDLQHGLRRAGQTNGHRRIDYGRAFAFAESVCRARDEQSVASCSLTPPCSTSGTFSRGSGHTWTTTNQLERICRSTRTRPSCAPSSRCRPDPSARWPKLVVSIIATQARRIESGSGQPHQYEGHCLQRCSPLSPLPATGSTLGKGQGIFCASATQNSAPAREWLDSVELGESASLYPRNSSLSP